MAGAKGGISVLGIAVLFMAVTALWGLSTCTDEASGRDGGADSGKSCNSSLDCKANEVCLNHVCLPASSCLKNEDCKTGEECVGGKCIAVIPDAGMDGGDGGVPDAGNCTTKSDCQAGERCNPENHGCEAAAIIEVDPPSLNFGAVPFGQEVQLDLTITNKGKLDLLLTGFDVINPDPDNPCFAIVSGGETGTLKPDAYRTVKVSYKQVHAFADTGTLQITSSDLDKALTKVPLMSVYKGEPKLKIVDRSTLDVLYPKPGDPTTYAVDFGTVPQGDTVTKVVTFRNGTEGDAILEFMNLKETSATDNKFTYKFYDNASDENRNELTIPIYMMKGDMVDMEVVFSPKIKTASDITVLELKTNDKDVNGSGSGGDTLTLNLQAQGAKPNIVIECADIVSGEINYGDWHIANPLPEKKIVRVKNTGGSDLTLKGTSGLEYSGTAYAINPSPLPDKISPNAWVDVEVAFAPTVVGQALNNLIFDSDDPDTPHISIALKGWGVNPTLNVMATPNKGTPSKMDFGNVYKGVPVTGNVAVTNSGAGNLTIYKAPYLAAWSAADYTLTNVKVNGSAATFPVIIRDSGQDQLTFDIQMNPTVGGEATAAAVLENNDVKNLNFNMQIHAYVQYNNGDPCNDGAECSSGNCVNNYCCNDACSGDCIRCDVTGHKGTCTTVDSMCDPFICNQSTGHCKTSCSQHADCINNRSCCGSNCFDHSTYDNDRPTAVDLGTDCGMMKCWACAGGGGYRDYRTMNGQKGKWFKVAVSNSFSICGQNLGCWENYDVNNKVYLTAPAGITWKACLYDEASGSPASCGTANGNTIELTISHPKNYLSGEKYIYYIEVQYVNGYGCGDWTVLVKDVSC